MTWCYCIFKRPISVFGFYLSLSQLIEILVLSDQDNNLSPTKKKRLESANLEQSSRIVYEIVEMLPIQ